MSCLLLVADAGAAQQSVQSDLSSEVAGFVLQICMYSYVV